MIKRSRTWSSSAIIRRILQSVLVGGIAAGTIFVAAGLVTTLPGEEPGSQGGARNQSFHVRMSDGVRIAVDVWYPKLPKTSEKTPALMHMTRYWRAREVTFPGRALYGLQFLSSQDFVPEDVEIFNQRGYAVVLIDARGSGASFGSRVAELGPREIADYGEIADWIANQQWSNKRVGTYGISYNGNAAELALASGSSSIKAVAPQFSDFDFQSGVLQPGGAQMDFVPKWARMVKAMDENDICGADDVSGWDCIVSQWFSGGVKPVDGASGQSLLRQALADHQSNASIGAAFANVQFRDDLYGGSSIPISQLNPYGNRDGIQKSDAPMQVWAGWFDASTTAGALSRYATFSNPQDLIIGSFSHGGGYDTDPLKQDGDKGMPGTHRQYHLVASFFDRYLKGATQFPKRQITYYTMGKRRWCRSSTWPPAGMRSRKFYFGAERQLLESDTTTSGIDRYKVDFSHSTGSRNRWMTNLDYGDVIYGDHSKAGAGLLHYTSRPLESELIITGSPMLQVQLASDREQFTLHAYLEGVFPNGRSYHLAESILRSVHFPLSTDINSADVFGSRRSYMRKDARLPKKGEINDVELSMTPVSVAIPKGHRLRISIAGADAGIFPRHPSQGDVNWTVYYGANRSSMLGLPTEGPDSCQIVDPFTIP